MTPEQIAQAREIIADYSYGNAYDFRPLVAQELDEVERLQISVGKLNDAGWEANAEIEKLRAVAEAAWQAVSWLPNMEPIANTPRDTEHNRSAWALRQALKTWRGE